MVWELPVIAAIFSFVCLITIYMATRTKQPDSPSQQSVERSDEDLEKLALKVAEVVAVRVANEIVEKLGQVSYHGPNKSVMHVGDKDIIEMDESVIPMSVDIGVESDNLDQMASQEVKEDKDLVASKSKLANMLKRNRSK